MVSKLAPMTADSVQNKGIGPSYHGKEIRIV